MAFDCGANRWIVAKVIRRLAERVARIGTNVGFVKIKVGVKYAAAPQFVGRGSSTAGAAVATVTLAVALAEPPGPLAVIV